MNIIHSVFPSIRTVSVTNASEKALDMIATGKREHKHKESPRQIHPLVGAVNWENSGNVETERMMNWSVSRRLKYHCIIHKMNKMN